jgi:hypothetical protein
MENWACTILDIDDPDWPYVETPYFEPPQKSIAVNYQPTAIRYRSEPWQTYIDTDAQTWNLSLKIVASATQGDMRTSFHVAKDIRFLESLEYPDYGEDNEDFVRPPHRCRIRMVNIFDEFGFIRDLNIQPRESYDEDGMPQLVDVQFTFVVMHNQPLSYSQVRDGWY